MIAKKKVVWRRSNYWIPNVMTRLLLEEKIVIQNPAYYLTCTQLTQWYMERLILVFERRCQGAESVSLVVVMWYIYPELI